ncbi:AbrB family transcriptional regulator [Brevibacillus ginsengisoli]|uniref:AbrB family transcriptional regulator n=1 Tax=Brevibacillus ginsengisoli TaxID=363854 RepID=UPI003CED25C6
MKIVETFIVAIIGAVVFSLLHIPLAWMLGSITGVMIWHLGVKRELDCPFSFRQVASVLFGYMLGTSFTRETAWDIGRQLPYMAVTTISLVLFSLAMGYLVAKKSGISVASGIFGSVPGGLSQMLVISEEIEEANVSIVSFMQTIRLLAVIFIIPFLTVHGLSKGAISSAGSAVTSNATSVSLFPWWTYLLYIPVAITGAWGGKLIRLPAAIITGPLLFTAIIAIVTGIQAPPLPGPLLIVSQLIFGAYIGLTMKVSDFGIFKKIGGFTVTSSILLVGAALAISQVLAYLTGASASTSFLSTAPGGIAEMGVTASIVHADLSMVSSYQLFRMFFIMLFVPPLLKKWLLWRKNRSSMLATGKEGRES